MMSSEVGECSVLVLLDLCAAFDTVDHSVLAGGLGQWAGASEPGLVLWSFLLLAPYMSETASPSCGVPHGSVLGPFLFALSMLSLGYIISKCKGIPYHCYADETDKLTILHNCQAMYLINL